MTTIGRSNPSGVPSNQIQQQESIDSAQQNEAAAPTASNQPITNNPAESRAINSGMQKAEAFLSGNLLAAELQAQLKPVAPQGSENASAGSGEVQQSVPIFSEVQPNGSDGATGEVMGWGVGVKPATGEVIGWGVGVKPEDSPNLADERLELKNNSFEINAEGNLTINDTELAERIKANLKKTE
jgi:hypothetical protein